MDYALVDSSTGEVVNRIVLSTAAVPPMPLESDRPVLPEPPVAPELPEYPASLPDGFTEEELSDYEDAVVAYDYAVSVAQDAYNAAYAAYLEYMDQYAIDVVAYNDLIIAAMKYRFTPPEGYRVMETDAAIGAFVDVGG